MTEHDTDQDGALRVLIVCQGDLSGASEKQALGLAQHLTALGHPVMLSLFGDAATAAREGATGVPGLTLRWHRFRGRTLRRADLRAAKDFRPGVIHAFSARAPVVAASRAYRRATGAPVAVHWEDDEIGIRRQMFGRSLYRRAGRLGRHLVCAAYPPAGPFVTARGLRWVTDTAVAHDALTPALAEHMGAWLGTHCAVVLPVTPRASGAHAAPARLTELTGGRAPLMITGEIHPGSVADVRGALDAVAEVQRRGHQVAFVHAGRVLPRYDVAEMVGEAGLEPGTAHFLGYLPFSEIPGLLGEAAILLQPGEPSEFNRLRLPSKMQAYLAAGVPTITFAVGFAELLEDGVEALFVRTADPTELAARIEDVLVDDDLRARLAHGARRAAERLFDPECNAAAMADHYRRAICRATLP